MFKKTAKNEAGSPAEASQNPVKARSIIVEGVKRPANNPLAGVKHVIAIGSGKGGVGKSTCTANLALALNHLGAKVGVLDADIYGPSIPRLLGVKDLPSRRKEDSKIEAPMAHGIKVMSMGLLNPGTTIWRGPIASRAVTQFVSEVDWGELDYLLLDLPPGTGDVQLSLCQSLQLSGAIVVMTPQELAVEVAKKGLDLFTKLRVPVLGLVENMSYFVCDSCDKKHFIFREGGTEKLAKEIKLPVLGSLPLDPKMVELSDAGENQFVKLPEAQSTPYLNLAYNFAAELEERSKPKEVDPADLKIVDYEANMEAKMYKFTWSDGKQSLVSFKELRYQCPCANCVDEGTGVRIIKKEDVADNVVPNSLTTVGHYAISISWSDKHDSGIYSYERLRQLLSS